MFKLKSAVSRPKKQPYRRNSGFARYGFARYVAARGKRIALFGVKHGVVYLMVGHQCSGLWLGLVERSLLGMFRC